jgi:hypothetical protein
MRLLLPRSSESVFSSPHSVVRRTSLPFRTIRVSVEIDVEIAARTGWFGSPSDEFLLPWRSISAEQHGGLDAKATGLERIYGCRTHHR